MHLFQEIFMAGYKISYHPHIFATCDSGSQSSVDHQTRTNIVLSMAKANLGHANGAHCVCSHTSKSAKTVPIISFNLKIKISGGKKLNIEHFEKILIFFKLFSFRKTTIITQQPDRPSS